MHFADKVIHGIELSLRRMDDDIHAFTNDVEIRVGNQDCDFNKGICGQI